LRPLDGRPGVFGEVLRWGSTQVRSGQARPGQVSKIDDPEDEEIEQMLEI
jgi:hypothetical protein